MVMTTLIGDISRAINGSEQNVVGHIKSFCRIQNVEHRRVIVVARAEHVTALMPELPDAEWVSVPDAMSAVAAVNGVLHRLAAAGQREVGLLSFSGEVMRLAASPGMGLVIRTYPLSLVRTMVEGTGVATGSQLVVRSAIPPAEGSPVWTFEHLATVDEAIETLVQVLRQRAAYSSATAIRQTSLRPWMGLLNARFAGNALATRSSGMIAILLAIANQRGVIKVSGDNPGDLFIWLSEPTPEAIAGPTSGPPEVAKDGHAGSRPGTGLVASKSRAPRDVERYRAHKFSAKLEECRVGPFPDARPFVYQAMIDIVNSGDSQPFADLVALAVDRGRELAVAAGRSPRQPWPAVRKVMERLLLRAGAVTDNQNIPLPNSWASGKTIVCGLSDQWQVKTDAEIVLTLIEKVPDVSGDDILDIARSLYHSSKSEARAQVHAVLELLIASNRIVDDGLYFRPAPMNTHGGEASGSVRSPVH
jgi:hypothetical protein